MMITATEINLIKKIKFIGHLFKKKDIILDELVDVIGIASTEAGAILYEASQKLEKGTPGVYEYLNLIGEWF